jgi:phospholipid-binding lipoprotein MlaA
LTSIAFISGCVSTVQHTPDDPYEGFNRKVFAFNQTIDKFIFRPIAKTYDFIFPSAVKKAVSNFFSNIGDISNIPNDVLQGNFQHAGTDLFRVAVNTTAGIGGLFDVASVGGIPKYNEDFGLTLAKWGAKNTHYLVLPILGPSTFRDAPSLIADYVLDPVSYVQPDGYRYAADALRAIDKRSKLLPSDRLVREAFDPYIFVRDAYMQRRSYLMSKNEEGNNKTEVQQNEYSKNL